MGYTVSLWGTEWVSRVQDRSVECKMGLWDAERTCGVQGEPVVRRAGL